MSAAWLRQHDSTALAVALDAPVHKLTTCVSVHLLCRALCACVLCVGIDHGGGADGLLMPFCRTLNKAGVPLWGGVATCVITAVIALMMSLTELADAISIGTLSAFSVVDAGIIVLR